MYNELTRNSLQNPTLSEGATRTIVPRMEQTRKLTAAAQQRLRFPVQGASFLDNFAAGRRRRTRDLFRDYAAVAQRLAEAKQQLWDFGAALIAPEGDAGIVGHRDEVDEFTGPRGRLGVISENTREIEVRADEDTKQRARQKDEPGPDGQTVNHLAPCGETPGSMVKDDADDTAKFILFSAFLGITRDI